MAELRLPQDEGKPEPPSRARLIVLVVAAGFGAYLILSGVIGLLTGGGG